MKRILVPTDFSKYSEEALKVSLTNCPKKQQRNHPTAHAGITTSRKRSYGQRKKHSRDYVF